MSGYMREIKVPCRRIGSASANLETEYARRTLTPTFRDATSPELTEKAQKPYSLRSVQYIQGLPWGARCSSADYVQRSPWSGNCSRTQVPRQPYTLTDLKNLMLSEIQFFHGKDERFKFPAIRGIQSLTHKPKIGSAWSCKNEAFRQMYQSSTFQPRYRILSKEAVIHSSGSVPVK